MKSPTQDDLDRFVRNNVHYCVSALVSTLAKGYGALDGALHDATRYGSTRVTGNSPLGELSALAEQAFELSSPVDDYEEAANQAGWRWDEGGPHFYKSAPDVFAPYTYAHIPSGDWQELCEQEGIDPYQWEIYEHWIVSDWLADALERHGERVDKDFAGLTVWGRTTTGQAIAMDSVIERIWRELHRGD